MKVMGGSTNLQERLARFPDPLARILVHILLTDMGTPLLDHFLLENIDLVEGHQDFGNEGDEVRVSDTRKTLNTSKEGLLVLLRGDHLEERRISGLITPMKREVNEP